MSMRAVELSLISSHLGVCCQRLTHSNFISRRRSNYKIVTPHTAMQSLIHRVGRLATSQAVCTRSAVPLSFNAVAALPSNPILSHLTVRHASTRANKQLMGRSFTGIFAGKHISFGNMVSHSERKTRRSWKPNVHRKTFYSQVLEKELSIKVTMAALRTFDKYGGIDRYILRTPYDRLDEGYSRHLRATMELALLKDPTIAQDLNLMDILERLKKPKDYKRLAATVEELQARSRTNGHMNDPILRVKIPDGTIPPLPVVTQEQRAARLAARMAKQNARYLARKKLLAEGPTIQHASANGILIPKNVARAPVWTGKRQRRASYDHPFTRPTKERPQTQP